MEQKFSNNSIDLQMLREFCEGEGELVEYRKGDQMEREGDPSRWFGYVTEGCFKYVNHGIMPSRVLRVTGQQLEQFFNQSKDTMKLRAVIAEHILFQFRSRYLDLHCATARERYELLLRRCPGIVHHLALQDLASFLCVTPNYLSTIRKDITFETKK